MHKLLVTGGCGFIGSHTCFSLLKSGYKIVVLDSNINSTEEPLEKLKEIKELETIDFNSKLQFINGDIRDYSVVNKIFKDALNIGDPIQGVIHFAGLKSVSESITNPTEYWDVNFLGSLSLIKVMEEHNCQTIVFSSSASIYSSSNKQPLNESSLINPISPYGMTKVAVENMLISLTKKNNNIWRIANLRYFNPIGAHPSGLIGEDPIIKNGNLFPELTNVANGVYEKLVVYGNDWPTKDGTGIRDYIHVIDLAEGHKAALEFLFNNSPQVININLGTGLGTSVLEMIKTFEKVTHKKIPYVFSERRSGDIPISIADNKLALEKLDWEPKRNLDDMCRDAWNWKIKNPDGFLFKS